METRPRTPVFRYLFALLVVIALCACASASAFFVGRQTGLPLLPEPTQVPPTPIQTPSPAPVQETPELQTTPEAADPGLSEPGPSPTPMPTLDRDGGLPRDNMDLFFEVWEIIAGEFDGDLPSEQDLIHSAISGSIETLDDEFTRFIPANIANRLREDLQGSFEGIGAYVRTNEEGFLQIVRPIAGQPAAREGLRAGDIILQADGIDLRGMDVDEAVTYVRGPRGTQVTLVILREDETFEVTITRDRIEIPTVEYELLPEGIAYVRLTSFNRVATDQLQRALDEMLAQNPSGLIFDLRDNPGGFLDQAVSVADIFLPEGVVLYERNLRGLDEVFRSGNGGVAVEIPLVVLINAGSASASEIVAGAIQDRERAVLIGETTFGKGSVQLPHNLSDGSELRVTIARWYTPNNNSIDGVGVSPDIEELPSPLELGGPEDNQLQRAVQYLLQGE
jgi:carboxyl-terminal processing protease